MIKIKDLKVLDSLLIHPYHSKMRELLKWFCVRYSETVFTGGYEERNYPSVHSVIPVRGMDVRSWVFSDPQAVVNDINSVWIYDPKRPGLKCAVYHNTGRGAHIHLQVHNNTIYEKQES